jgi:hypothetical protein
MGSRATPAYHHLIKTLSVAIMTLWIGGCSTVTPERECRRS